jgi:hypothetical protein
MALREPRFQLIPALHRPVEPSWNTRLKVDGNKRPARESAFCLSTVLPLDRAPYVFSAEFVLQPAGAGIPLSAIRLSGLE